MKKEVINVQFDYKAFLLFLLFLLIEILIGVFVKDSFIRPCGGDFLVIFLVYYFAKTFIKTNPLYLVVGVVLFAYTVEIAQYFKIVDILQIKNKILRIIIGTSFSWEDIWVYTLGGVCCYVIEKKISNKKAQT